MDGFDQIICRSDDDRAANKLCSLTFPVIPEAGKGKQAAISHADMVRLLSLLLLLPFVEASRRNQAAFVFERFAVGGFVGNRLRPGIDR